MKTTEQIFENYIFDRPIFMALVRSQEITIYQKYLKLFGKVLDIGCGDGVFMHYLKRFSSKSFKQVREMIGIDISETTIHECQKYYKGDYQSIIKYDGKKLPFINSSFDSIFTNCVLEHIPSLEKSLSEMNRVLKPNGKIYGTAMTKNWDKYTHPSFFWKKIQAHYSNFSVEKFSLLFIDCGFKIKTLQGYLPKEQTNTLLIWHFLSIPYLLTYKLFGSWSIAGRIYQKLIKPKYFSQFFKEKTNLNEASAIYFELEKIGNSKH